MTTPTTPQPEARALTERDQFEFAERASDLTRDTEEPDDYRNPCVQSCWEGWQARAALSTAPVQGVLPSLPEPTVVSYVTDSVMRTHELRTYCAEDMRAYGEACARAALAAAAPTQPTKGELR